jgi:glycosyltransferase involved in cell wall biosynthesis
LKIVHLIFSEQVAGAERYLLDLLPGLQLEGIECSLICVTPPADQHKFTGLCNELNNKGVNTILMAGKATGFYTIAKQINKYMRQNDIHYLHAHLFKSDLLAVMVKKLFNRKVMLLSTKHGYEEKYCSNYHHYKGKINYNLYYFISKFINANIDRQFAVSKAMANLYFNLKLTKTKLPFIHHGVTIPAMLQNTDAAAYRLAPQQLIILGRIEEVKGHKYLLEAMPEVIKVFPDVKLLVIGNGTQKDNLQMQAADTGIEKNILFLGFQNNPLPYLVQTDLMVAPSLYESFGLVFIEAFAMKLPVIAFDAPAANEIINNNETGLLVPVYDSKILAKKIIYLLQQPAEKNRLAENGYKKYVDYFNTARMVAQTAAWYRSTLPV